MPDTEQPWTRRMAEQLCSDTLTPELVECVLEAAGELKAARLRMLLAQCYEILQHSDVPLSLYSGFLHTVERELK